MKKILILIFMLFALVGFAACNGSTTIDINYDEQIAFPTNLTIEGKVLSWDAVEKADGYYVYNNGEEVASVKTNSYDFSKLTGDRFIFTVVTKAPKGMQDSVESTSIAYIANKEQEVEAMKLAVSDSIMPFGDAFAEELVNKGMLAAEFEAMMTAAEQFNEDMDEVNSFEGFFTALDAMMGEVVLPEALISALVLHVLPGLIDEQIENLEDDILWYQMQKNSSPYYWDQEYYQDRIDDAEREILALEELKALLTDSPEEVIKTILVVVDYVMEFQAMISQDLVQYITNLTETDGPQDMNVDEVVLIKEELVNILRETMPSQQEVTLVIQTLYSLSAILENMEGIVVGDLQTPEKASATLLLSFSAYINFIDNFDREFFVELKSIAGSDVSEYRMQAELAILMITYFDNFKEENQDLLDDIKDVYTEQEKEAMFNQYMDSLEEAIGNDMPLDLSLMTFARMMALDAIFSDAFDNVLDAFVASEGAILLLVAEMQEYEDDFYSTNNYWENYDEYDFNMTLYNFKIVNEVVYLVNSVVSQISQEEFEEVRSFLVDYILQAAFVGLAYEMEESEVEIEDLVNAIKTFIENTSTEQYGLIQSVFAYLDNEDVLLDYAALYEAAYEHSDGRYFYDYQMHWNFAFMFGVYDELVTTQNRGYIDNILAEIVILLENEVFADLMLPSGFINQIEDVLDYIETVSAEVAAFDPANLTEANRLRIEEIMNEISEMLMMS